MYDSEKMEMEEDGQMVLTQVDEAAMATAVETINGYFADISFKELASSIEMLANSHDHKMSDSEKQIASEIIDRWQEDVVNAISEKEREANSYIHSFESSSPYMRIPEEELETVVNATGTRALYDKYIALKENVVKIEMDHPKQYRMDIDDTVQDVIDGRESARAKQLKYNIKLASARTMEENALVELKKELLKHEVVREFLRKARSYKRKVSKFKKECHEKGQLAKICVLIDNENVQKVLKELVDFSVKC